MLQATGCKLQAVEKIQATCLPCLPTGRRQAGKKQIITNIQIPITIWNLRNHGERI